MRTVHWEDGSVLLIDQSALPIKLKHVRLTKAGEVASAIKTMVVRGAPAIGVAAAMGIALAARTSNAKLMGEFMADLDAAASLLLSTRPTAVNLSWGVERAMNAARRARSVPEARRQIVSEVKKMEEQDVETNRKLGKIGSALIKDGDTVLTQCNAGALATVGYGTALGVVRAAVESGKMVKVMVPETRPALQGARLTAFELERDGIPCTLIPDTAVGYMLSLGRADLVVVGADRITRDGYVFNKIGTYQEAVLANRHGVPFYVAAPSSTFDLELSHQDVSIEQRGFEEVTTIRGRRIAPKRVPVVNPAFDETPPELVSGIITEKGVIRKPSRASISRVIS